MDFKQVILRFLGIQDVIIEDVKLFDSELRAVFCVRQKRCDAFCSRCGLEFDGVHEWIFKELKAPPLGIYQNIVIKLYQLRGHCSHCDKSSMANLEWIHPEFPSMTCGFAEVAGRLMEEITCEAVGRILKSNSMQLWRLDQWRMEFMLTRLRLPKKIDITYLSADEVHFKTVRIASRKGLWAKRWQPEFVTNLVCPAEGKVLFNALGRDSAALNASLAVLSPGQLLAVERFSVDMHEPFISAIKRHCPNAEVTIDRFHLAQAVNRAFDQLRRVEFKLAKKQNDQLSIDMLEPHRRFILMSRNRDLSRSEQKLLDKLRAVNKNIHTGLILVEYFHKALDKTTLPAFRRALFNWYMVVREAKLPSFKAFAKTIRRYRHNIEAYITSRLTNGVAEGLNNKIKTLKRMGYGYSNPVSFLRKILQRCGYLNHLSINTDEFFFRIPNPTT